MKRDKGAPEAAQESLLNTRSFLILLVAMGMALVAAACAQALVWERGAIMGLIAGLSAFLITFLSTAAALDQLVGKS